jgi:hypothetical protein
MGVAASPLNMFKNVLTLEEEFAHPVFEHVQVPGPDARPWIRWRSGRRAER